MATIVEILREMKYLSYQLWIRVGETLKLRVGSLGVLELPAGVYIYTGSARRNLEHRIRRHLSAVKRIRWHIDYLLSNPGVRVLAVHRSREEECSWNRATQGEILFPGFGSSDCASGCISHLKYVLPFVTE
jgi:Uri superfamily endonuclease